MANWPIKHPFIARTGFIRANVLKACQKETSKIGAVRSRLRFALHQTMVLELVVKRTATDAQEIRGFGFVSAH